MAQPWQFLGYQKLSSWATTVSFTNMFPSGTNASSYWDFRYKLVIETLSTNQYDNGTEPGAYYGIRADSNPSWDIAAYSQHDNNQASGTSYTWSTSPSATANQLTYAFREPYWGWLMTKGATSGSRRYSSNEDDLQWGTHEVQYTKQHSTGHNMQMHSFNVQSTSDNSTQAFNGYIATSGENNTSVVSSLNINAANQNFLAGSKFWLWACRTTNDY
tara:strand:+ start:785 stop:1432 length:648 start_codon:yes stop_codon:yes gene_type:complete